MNNQKKTGLRNDEQQVEDTEGHARRHLRQGEAEEAIDTEGHKKLTTRIGEAEETIDTEGHRVGGHGRLGEAEETVADTEGHVNARKR
jgi:hypothetical protein